MKSICRWLPPPKLTDKVGIMRAGQLSVRNSLARRGSSSSPRPNNHRRPEQRAATIIRFDATFSTLGTAVATSGSRAGEFAVDARANVSLMMAWTSPRRPCHGRTWNGEPAQMLLACRFNWESDLPDCCEDVKTGRRWKTQLGVGSDRVGCTTDTSVLATIGWACKRRLSSFQAPSSFVRRSTLEAHDLGRGGHLSFGKQHITDTRHTPKDTMDTNKRRVRVRKRVVHIRCQSNTKCWPPQTLRPLARFDKSLVESTGHVAGPHLKSKTLNASRETT